MEPDSSATSAIYRAASVNPSPSATSPAVAGAAADEQPSALSLSALSLSDAEPVRRQLERILATRIVNGTRRYLLKWAGLPVSASTWERAAAIHCPVLMASFERSEWVAHKTQMKYRAKVRDRRRAAALEGGKMVSIFTVGGWLGCFSLLCPLAASGLCPMKFLILYSKGIACLFALKVIVN